ncbi:hypothetical protein [Clostridium fallax]|uniref:Uncharacterized protein n=1 Tax=Clostridium fallax TaxID=1533 RepID=A0A1M4UYS1_9CLOT|nr:hypothetical protein [Clostridium fallax]SHE61787.1 hypothetical protein SAMN05443638_10661 [Clostridium fallax]SQB06709.1 Uncharacterised protein [Clostridium fallax]
MYSKIEVIDYVWQYSRCLGNLLGSCYRLEEYEEGQILLFNLFNITEVIFKSVIEDYESRFIDIIDKLKKYDYINDIECNFLNDKKIGIRKFRNLLAHANLSKYNVIFLDEDNKLMYPLTENETCMKLYNLFSDILFNLILKVVKFNNIKLDNEIKNINIEIMEISDDELLLYKGFEKEDIKKLNNNNIMSEDTKYRLAENSQDIQVLESIFKNLFIK